MRVSVVIPHTEYETSPFHYPSTPTLVQLLAKGEFFHGRSKVCRSGENKRVTGVYGTSDIPEELASDKTSEELTAILNEYHNSSYLLT